LADKGRKLHTKARLTLQRVGTPAAEFDVPLQPRRPKRSATALVQQISSMMAGVAA
jgi:hypothetical protein